MISRASLELGKLVDLEGDDSRDEGRCQISQKSRLRLRIPEPDEESRRSIRAGPALIKDSEKHDALGKLSRYEASLANALTRTLSLLHSIQASRLVASDDFGSRGQ
jgi:hypothetical protein